MSDVMSTEAAPAGLAGGRGRRPGASAGPLALEVTLAAVAFAALCVLVLRTTPFMPEPDDYAYQGSIVAMTQGHFLTLSTAQMQALAAQLADPGSRLGVGPGGVGIPQWVQLADGRWISEKDPGYPFLAAPFQALGIIRWAPLFYGALACLGLFAGARRWLGRFGGAAAVGLYCSSGAALLFAWRDYMPTFTDASLVAAGTGALLWAMLATEASSRRRTWVGLAGFLAMEAATFARYTDIVVLGCAVVAVLLAWRWRVPGGRPPGPAPRAARLPGSALAWWLGSVAVFGIGVATFDDLVYGGPLRSGYAPGEIQFSLSAIWPNLRYMPAHLISAMPVLFLGLAALAWMIVRWVLSRRAPSLRPGTTGASPAVARSDLAVGLALAGSWAAVWGLYAAYTWTATPFLSTLQSVRFYVPALGAISLLGAWLVTRVPGRAWLAGLTSVAVVAAAFWLGARSFNQMVAFPRGGGVIRIGRCPGQPVPGRPGPGQPGPGQIAKGRPGPGRPGLSPVVRCKIGPGPGGPVGRPRGAGA